MISLIVLNYNDKDTTIEFINSVKDFDAFDNIIVVDNFSSDDSYEKLLPFKNEKIDIIRTQKNLGYAGGNNFGIKYALQKYNSKYFFIANPDIEIKNENAKKIIDVANNKKNLGIISSKMISDDNLLFAWKLPSFFDCVFEQLIILKKVFGQGNEYKKSYFYDKEVSKVDVVAGSFFLITKDAFEAVSGFDEDTFLYYEETIIAHKLKEKGFESFIINDLEYNHKHSLSIDKSIKSSREKLKVAFNSRQIYCKKYLKAGPIKMFILKLSFYIGLFDYLVAKKILGKK